MNVIPGVKIQAITEEVLSTLDKHDLSLDRKVKILALAQEAISETNEPDK